MIHNILNQSIILLAISQNDQNNQLQTIKFL